MHGSYRPHPEPASRRHVPGRNTEVSHGQTAKKGDKVSWGTPQGETHGTVEKLVTSTTKIAGHVAKATPANPEVLVKSAKSGKQAIHKPAALKKA